MENYQIIIIVLFLVFFVWYLLTHKKRMFKKELKNKILADGINDIQEETSNIINSISKAKNKYKKLAILIHPDKFQDISIIQEAEEITSRLTHYKRNYKVLCEIEEEIKVFLNKT